MVLHRGNMIEIGDGKMGKIVQLHEPGQMVTVREK